MVKNTKSNKIWLIVLIAVVILLIIIVPGIGKKTEEAPPAATAEPTQLPTPTATHTPEPTPTQTPVPTDEPTAEPVAEVTAEPTAEPAPVTTAEPTAEITMEPQLTEPPATEVPVTEPPVTEVPETPVPTEEPTAEPVLVTAAEYELAYSGSMADVITYKEIPETELTDLVFYAHLGNRTEKIYTLALNSEEGEIVTMIENASGGQTPIAFVMEELPLNLSPQEEEIFCRAQETVNDVIASILLK